MTPFHRPLSAGATAAARAQGAGRRRAALAAVALSALLAGCQTHTGVMLRSPGAEALRLEAGSDRLPQGNLGYRVAALDTLTVEVYPQRSSAQKADFGSEVLLQFALLPGPYKVAPNDVLALTIDSDSERDITLAVRPDGLVTLPRLGVDLQVTGRTLAELTRVLQKSYAALLTRPALTLTLTRSAGETLSRLNAAYGVDRDGRISVPNLGTFVVLGRTAPQIQQQLAAAATAEYRNEVRVSAALAELPNKDPDPRTAPDGRRYFRGAVKVSVDGTLYVPDGGVFAAEGKTLEAINAEMTARIGGAFQNPVDVRLSLAEANSFSVFVGGEVRTPGRLVYQPSMTILQALAAAGWVNDTGDLAQVRLLHQTKPGEYAVYTTNLSEVIDAGKATFQDLKLSPRDLIVVPKTDIAKANLAVDQYIRRMLPFGIGVNYTIVNQATTTAATP